MATPTNIGGCSLPWPLCSDATGSSLSKFLQAANVRQERVWVYPITGTFCDSDYMSFACRLVCLSVCWHDYIPALLQG